jgi:DNA uptake protein ComE-like DNA-binding protein
MTVSISSATRRLTCWWYLPVTILTIGMFAWVPFLHAAVRLSRRRLYGTAVLYAVAGAAIILLLGIKAGTPQAIGTILGIATAATGSVHQVRLRREQLRVAAAPPAVENPAVTQALAARAQRQQARELAAKDPLLARELRIGRPDLTRTYDDGGLVDVNTAPAAALAEIFELDAAQAQAIVDARATFGGAFAAVDDVFAATELPLHTWDLIRDRGLVL